MVCQLFVDKPNNTDLYSITLYGAPFIGYSKYVQMSALNNSSPHSAAYMRQWIGSALVQIMACRLFGAKPLSKPILLLSIGPLVTNFNDILIKKTLFIPENASENNVSELRPFCPGGDEIIFWSVYRIHSHSHMGSGEEGLLDRHRLFIKRTKSLSFI